MSINLRKGEKIDLTKDRNLKNILVGLGWDCLNDRNSFWDIITGKNFDCDASVFMLDEDRNLKNSKDLIYFGNLKSKCGSVSHKGDNLTGEGDGDDEQILIDLLKIPNHIYELFFVVNIFNAKKRNQHFGMVNNAFIRVYDTDSNKELLRYDLSDDYSNKTAIVVAKIYRHNDNWKFTAIGQGTEDNNLEQLKQRLISDKKVNI